jgi:hypothetical protein
MTKTNLLPHLVVSTNQSASTNDLRAIKAPVAIPDPWFWIGCGVGLLTTTAVAWWLWRRWHRQQAAPPPKPVTPPHQIARAKLREALALLHEPRPFCILVSDTIRVYLEAQFDLHAPERTTEEFLEELQTSSVLSYEQKQALGAFLTSCDLVKFARYEPTQVELQSIYDAALRLVDETQFSPPRLEPAPVAPPSAP